MQSLPKAWILVALVMLGWAGSESYPAHAGGLEITGSYTLAGNRGTRLKISAADRQYTALLSGGNQQATGPAVAADCYIKAIGPLQGNILRAVFTALETDTFTYSETQAKAEKRQLKIVFSKNTAQVTQADTVGYCGWGADFVGRYHRRVGKR
jgi:hypothetical protein